MIFAVLIDIPLDDCTFLQDFYQQYKGLLYSEAKKLLDSPDDVDEIVQDTMVKLIEKVELLRSMPPGKQVHYAVTSVRNLSINLLLHNKRISFCSLDDIDDMMPASDDVEKQVQHTEFLREWRNIWMSIDLESRTLLERKYILRHSDAKIAEDLHIQPESVRMRLTRTKRIVVEILKQNGITLLDRD